MFDMNMDIQHLMEACDKSSGACSYNGKKKGNDANTNDPSSNEGCCKKEACPTTNEVCKNEGCKKESSVFDGAFQALDEFKGDIAAGYASSRRLNYFSGDHKIGKRQSNAAKKAAMRGGEDNRGTDEHYKDIAGSGKVTHDKYNAYNAKQDSYTKMRNNQESKPKRESASIFDGMFQALDEFKGDAEMQTLERNLHDKLSGDHDYAKTYRANKNKFRDDMSGRDINKGEVRTAKDEKRYREEKNAACKAADRISRNSSRSDMASDVRKYCGESTSIFNTLLDQV